MLSEEINRTQNSKEYGSYFLKDQYLNGNDRSTKRDSSKEIMMITGGKQMTILQFVAFLLIAQTRIQIGCF